MTLMRVALRLLQRIPDEGVRAASSAVSSMTPAPSAAG